jgi:hypothetical protein
VKKATKDLASSQQDLIIVKSGITEIDQLLKAYEQGLQTIGDPASFKTFADQKESMAEAALGAAGTAALDATVKKFETDLKPLNDEVKKRTVARNSALDDNDKAQQAATVGQNTYNAAKDTLAKAQLIVADIKNLQKQINASSDTGNFAGMYFLVLEMRSDLSTLNLPKKEDLKTTLTTALLALETAGRDAREKKDALDQAQADLASALKALDDKVAGRRAALLAQIQNPPTPKSAARP